MCVRIYVKEVKTNMFSVLAYKEQQNMLRMICVHTHTGNALQLRCSGLAYIYDSDTANIYVEAFSD